MAARWEYWLIRDAGTGHPAWLGVTRPGARAKIDRIAVWTLLAESGVFIANWMVTADFRRTEGAQRWTYEHVEVDQARRFALQVPAPSAADVRRLTRPEEALTLTQITRHPVARLLGTRTAAELAARRRD